MNNLQTILEQFNIAVEHEYDDCAAHGEGLHCCLDKEHDRNKLVKEFIKQAYLVGADYIALRDRSSVSLGLHPHLPEQKYFKLLQYFTYEQAKALQQIKYYVKRKHRQP